ncbi:hypothetical protein, partial [Aeromicrobium sp.]|uniref:hypothetical protein n=1 Tax=Aeromicrobium sp. TaxID=1871063 RepID=UPI0019829EB3
MSTTLIKRPAAWIRRLKARRRRGVPMFTVKDKRSAIASGVGVVVLLGIVFALQASSASSHLRTAATQSALLQSQIVTGDQEGAQATLGALETSTASARKSTDGLLWDISSKV